MSPEERAAAASLARLRQELTADRQILERCREEIEGLLELDPEALDRSRTVHLAALIHGYYTGIESLLERILRVLDREIPTGDRWHESLLFQAVTEMEGIRPAIVDPRLREELDSLRRFRHFFRHAYGLELDAERVVEEARRLVAIDGKLDPDLDRFETFLEQSEVELRRER